MVQMISLQPCMPQVRYGWVYEGEGVLVVLQLPAVFDTVTFVGTHRGGRLLLGTGVMTGPCVTAAVCCSTVGFLGACRLLQGEVGSRRWELPAEFGTVSPSVSLCSAHQSLSSSLPSTLTVPALTIHHLMSLSWTCPFAPPMW